MGLDNEHINPSALEFRFLILLRTPFVHSVENNYIHIVFLACDGDVQCHSESGMFYNIIHNYVILRPE